MLGAKTIRNEHDRRQYVSESLMEHAFCEFHGYCKRVDYLKLSSFPEVIHIFIRFHSTMIDSTYILRVLQITESVFDS